MSYNAFLETCAPLLFGMVVAIERAENILVSFISIAVATADSTICCNQLFR
jgi:hypothetical protein